MRALVERLRAEPRRALRERLAHGFPIDPGALEGWAYRGTSLGLPRVIERLTWTTFQKTFFRDPLTGRLRGWNVRLEQDGPGAPSRPRLRRGLPVTTGPYEVVTPAEAPMPPGFDRGLVIDYGRASGGLLGLVRDPLVALEAGSADLLLGVSAVTLGGRLLETPTYFVLEREHRLTSVPEAPSPLLAFERRWAELLFEAIVGTELPALSSTRADRAGFWRCVGETTPPYFLPGLRAAVHALTFLPLTLAGFRRPFFALSAQQRLACVERLAEHPRLAVRQLVSTVKLVACLALFEDDGARRRLDGGQAP